jgi:hypothetical protein
MMVNKNMIAGKIAIKNLKAMEEARVVIAPSSNPLRKNFSTSYKDIPSKPGRTKFLRITTIIRTSRRFLIFM